MRKSHYCESLNSEPGREVFKMLRKQTEQVAYLRNSQNKKSVLNPLSLQKVDYYSRNKKAVVYEKSLQQHSPACLQRSN